MPLYNVEFPVILHVAVSEVEAKDKDDALEKAHEQYSDACAENRERDYIIETATPDAVVTGNVYHGPINRATVELIEEEPDAD